MCPTSEEKTHESTEAFPKIQSEAGEASTSTDQQDVPTRVDSADDSISSLPGPTYGGRFERISGDEGGVGTEASITIDGRVNIRINQRTRGLSSLLVPALQSRIDLNKTLAQQSASIPPSLGTQPGGKPPPPLHVAIHVVGSRGDVQPFIALGKVLKDKYSHRVRLATHPVFKDFVEDNGLEFFSIGGDPSELMAFMVKNPGLMPGFDSLKSGDVGRRRREIAKMIKGCWRSCIEVGDGMTESSVDDLINEPNVETLADSPRPFIADAIIANPPSFAHIHCAEKLGIPLHIMFTMPWSPTSAFPHPLANIQASNADFRIANFLTYTLVDMMTWQGLGDVINRFRQRVLKLEPVSLTWAPGMLNRLKVPTTYCWSPALIPKPLDWGPHISVAGFYFLSQASNYTPEPALAKFLEAGPPPVYIGFGSIVVDDPDGMTQLIFEAVRKSGQRALVSKGWGGFGAEEIGIPDGVFMLGNCPHDWLFQRVSCVVHHGGAGTTAAGIAAGKPTVIVPFFGDQPFWGEMVAKARAGPEPLPYKDLTSDALANAIATALKPTTVSQAKDLAMRIQHEKGSETGANSFHAQLDVNNLRCQICPDRVAVWRIKRTNVRLSAFAAATLIKKKLLETGDIKLYRPKEHETDDGPPDPFSGGASALVGTATSMTMGFFDLPKSTLRALKVHPDTIRERWVGEGQEASPTTDSIARKESDAPQEAANDEDTVKAGSEEQSSAQPVPNSQSLSPDHHSRSLASKDILHPALRPRSRSNSETNPESSQRNSTAPPNDNSSSNLTTTASSSGSKERSRSRTDLQNRFDFKDAIGTGKGVYRITSAGIKSPMDFTLSLARGFHNAPRLYGDETVRKHEKITGIKSGLKAAGKEFHYGLYDGITGMVTQPIAGAKKEGAAGFFKGMGKGIGGIILKPTAGAWGIPGYTAKGMYRELYNMFGASMESYLIASRTAQGLEDLRLSTPEEQENVVTHWRLMRKYIRKRIRRAEEHAGNVSNKVKNAKNRDRSTSTPRDEVDEEIERQMLRRMQTTGTGDSSLRSPVEGEVDMNPLSNPSSLSSQSDIKLPTSLTPATDPSSNRQSLPPDTSMTDVGSTPSRPASTIIPEKLSQEDLDFEEAIRRSVEETSRGNAEEDRLIEQAIRASVAEIQTARTQGADDAMVYAAMERSIANAKDGSVPRELTLHQPSQAPQRGEDEDTAPPPYAPPLPKRSTGLSERSVYAESVGYGSSSALNLPATPPEGPRSTATSDTYIELVDDEQSTPNLPPRRPQPAPQPTQTQPQDPPSSSSTQQTTNAEGRHSESSDEVEYEFDDDEMRRAIEESRAMHEQHEQKRSRTERDEDVVMRYMLEQSRLEEEFKRKKTSGGEAVP